MIEKLLEIKPVTAEDEDLATESRSPQEPLAVTGEGIVAVINEETANNEDNVNNEEIVNNEEAENIEANEGAQETKEAFQSGETTPTIGSKELVVSVKELDLVKEENVTKDLEENLPINPALEYIVKEEIRRQSARLSFLAKEKEAFLQKEKENMQNRQSRLAKPNVKSMAPVKKSMSAAARPKFDLNESLKRPLTYKPYTGPIKKTPF